MQFLIKIPLIVKQTLLASLCFALACILGYEWEQLLKVNKNGQRDIQYSQSSDDEEDEDYTEEEEEDEYTDEEETEEEDYEEEEDEDSQPAAKTVIPKFDAKLRLTKNKITQLKTPKFVQEGTNDRTETGTGQKIYKKGNTFNAFYKFVNFSKDSLSIEFGMLMGDYSSYISNYGYKDSDLNKLSDWVKQARNDAWKKNISQGEAVAQKAVKSAEMEYDTKIRAFLYSRGLSLKATTKTIEPSVPTIVKRNKDLMKKIALSIGRHAKANNYGSEDIIGSVLSLVQTAIIYKIPPLIESNGTHIAGIFPPARTLLTGWGDCDTKTALLASILSNWPNIKMVGVSVPGHYLMAVRRLPTKGDMFIRYQGLEYVLLEPAGPAWLPPGQVGRATKDLLANRNSYTIEPFF